MNVPTQIARCLVLAGSLAIGGCGGGDTVSGPPPDAPETINVTLPFSGDSLPSKFTCDGAGEAPSVKISGVSQKSSALALLMEDPDAPGGTYAHWSVFNIDPQVRTISERSTRSAKHGDNSAGNEGYAPACPPEGDGPHRYVFGVYALDGRLDLPDGADPDAVRGAIADHATAKGSASATYER